MTYGPGEDEDDGAIHVLVRPQFREKVREELGSSISGIPLIVRPAEVPTRQRTQTLYENRDASAIDWVKVDRIDRKIKAAALPSHAVAAAATVQTSKYKHVFIIADPADTLILPPDRIGYDAINWLQVYPHVKQDCGDHYDFVAMYVDMQSRYLTGLNHHCITLYNNVTGIDHDEGGTNAVPYNIRPSYANTLRLRSYQVMHPEFADRYSRLHEIGHQWAAYVTGGLNNALRNFQFHWADTFETNFSPMSENTDRWGPGPSGTFCKQPYTDNEVMYSPLDLYLMGMLNRDEVAPPYYLTNLAVSGSCYHATQHSITLQSIIQNVWRVPDALTSPRTFRQAFVVITQSLQEGRDLVDGANQVGAVAGVGLGGLRDMHTREFRSATQSRAVLDTYLYDAAYDSVYIRDNNQDTGSDASAPPFWRSPDIWVRNQDDNGNNPQQTIRGQDNFVRVRIWNKGNQQSGEVTVNLYQANWAGTEFLYPDDWNVANRIGTQNVGSIPASAGGVDGQHILTFTWTQAKIPPSTWQHPCLLAEIIPIHPTLTGLRYVHEDRRLAQRNITIVDPPAVNQWLVFPFSIGANSGEARWVQLKISHEEGPVADGAELDLGTDDWGGRIGTDMTGATLLKEGGVTRVIIRDPPTGATIALRLEKAERRQLKLRLKWSAGSSANSSRFDIAQRNERGKVIGGVSLEVQSQ